VGGRGGGDQTRCWRERKNEYGLRLCVRMRREQLARARRGRPRERTGLRSVSTPSSLHSHTCGSWAPARSAVLPHVDARRRRKSSMVSSTPKRAAPRTHVAPGAIASARQQNARFVTTAPI
jgi:hypothetical protein